MEMELKNKDVVICKTDNFKKKGKILDANTDFIELLMYDGQTEIIPTKQISSIKIIGNGEGNGR
jgi:hypothetical protein